MAQRLRWTPSDAKCTDAGKEGASTGASVLLQCDETKRKVRLTWSHSTNSSLCWTEDRGIAGIAAV